MPLLRREGSLHRGLPRSAKRPGSPINVGVLESQDNLPVSNPSRMQLPATLCSPQLSLSVLALIDSGAEGNFLDSELATQSGFPIETLSETRTARSVDGRILAHVTHVTLPIKLVLSGNHHEEITFNLITAPKYTSYSGVSLVNVTQPTGGLVGVSERPGTFPSTTLTL